MGKKDITQKSYFEDVERFADLMNAAYFGGDVILRADELRPVDSAIQKADEEGTYERLRDVVKMQTKDGSMFAVYVLQNQVKIDYGMLIRIMVEESMAYHKQVVEIRKRNKEKFGNVLSSDEFLCGFRRKDKIFPVYTLVLYWGDTEWNAADSLKDMVTIPVADFNLEKRLKEMLPDYRIHVYDLNKVKDFSQFKTSLRTLFEFYSYRQCGEELKKYINTHKTDVQKLDEESRFLLATMLKEKRLEEQLLKLTEKEGKEDDGMCKAIDELIEEGRREGRNEGVKRGRREGLRRGRVESILTFLEDMGSVSDSLKEKLKMQKDVEVLKRWLKLAANVKSIADFEKSM